MSTGRTYRIDVQSSVARDDYLKALRRFGAAAIPVVFNADRSTTAQTWRMKYAWDVAHALRSSEELLLRERDGTMRAFGDDVLRVPAEDVLSVVVDILGDRTVMLRTRGRSLF